MKLTNEQIKILSEGKIDWNKFYLQWQLDRKQYLSINEVLETIGLKWNKKEKAHIFDGEMLEEAIADIIESGECETLKETIKKFQFYPTPKEIADLLVEVADLQDHDGILEPSFWDGALLFAIQRTWKHFPLIYWVELDKKRYDEFIENKSKIENSLLNRYWKFVNMDFLDMTDEWKFSKIVMNPPFSKMQDAKHIVHAYSLLNKWGTLVSIASSSIQTRKGKIYDELNELHPEFIPLPEWSFKESGTMVSSVIIKITK